MKPSLPSEGVAERLLGWVMPNPSYFGWAVAGLGLFAAALSAPGQSFALSFYLEPLMREIGISRLEISWLYAAATLAAGVTLPLFGAWADRTSGGRFLGAVLLLMAAAMTLLACSRTVWMLAVSFFTLRLLGQGAIGIGALTMTIRWFWRYRGRAFAIVGLGYAVGEITFPSGILGMFALVGWRGSLIVLATVYAFFFAPLVFQIGREPKAGENSIEYLNHNHAPVRPSHRLGRAVRTPVFYGMTAVLTLSPPIITAVIFHWVALFRGISLVPRVA